MRTWSLTSPRLPLPRFPLPRLPLIGAAVLLASFYILGPALTLMRLDRAVRNGDRAMLARLVDWPSVRHGLAEDVAAGMLGGRAHAARVREAGLRPFGFSFVTAIADREMATRLTPDGLIRLAHAGGTGGAQGGAAPRFVGAWVDNLTWVTVRVRVPGQARPIRLGLRLEGGGWKLARVWLPRGLLRRATAGGAAAGAAAPPQGGTRSGGMGAPERGG